MIADKPEPAGSGGGGGGICAQFGTIENSTISGNYSTNEGGGVNVRNGMLQISNSTITGNRTNYIAGGGIQIRSTRMNESSLILRNSIVASNRSRTGQGKDILPPDTGTIAIEFSLLGDNGSLEAQFPETGSMPDSNGNLIGGAIGGMIDPHIGPLQDNGGPTRTHALLTESPAIDSGNPNDAAGVDGVPSFDQRGVGFSRVAGSAIDMGAFEMQQPLAGDFNADGILNCTDIDALVAEIASGNHSASFELTGDGLVDTLDRDEWLALAGSIINANGEPFSLGDINLDGFVDVSDFNIWNKNKFSENAAWCLGDVTADGFIDVLDFNQWNLTKFSTSPSLPVVATVLDDFIAAPELERRVSLSKTILATNFDKSDRDAPAGGGDETIAFDEALGDAHILLVGDELYKSDRLLVDGNSISNNVMIDGHQLSRVLHVSFDRPEDWSTLQNHRPEWLRS